MLLAAGTCSAAPDRMHTEDPKQIPEQATIRDVPASVTLAAADCPTVVVAPAAIAKAAGQRQRSPPYRLPPPYLGLFHTLDQSDGWRWILPVRGLPGHGESLRSSADFRQPDRRRRANGISGVSCRVLWRLFRTPCASQCRCQRARGRVDDLMEQVVFRTDRQSRQPLHPRSRDLHPCHGCVRSRSYQRNGSQRPNRRSGRYLHRIHLPGCCG